MSPGRPACTRSEDTPNSLQGIGGPGTLSLSGVTYTLVLPYLVNTPEEINGISIGLIRGGVIVTTAIVPEPGTLLLAGRGMVARLGCIQRWRKRRPREAL